MYVISIILYIYVTYIYLLSEKLYNMFIGVYFWYFVWIGISNANMGNNFISGKN